MPNNRIKKGDALWIAAVGWGREQEHYNKNYVQKHTLTESLLGKLVFPLMNKMEIWNQAMLFLSCDIDTRDAEANYDNNIQFTVAPYKRTFYEIVALAFRVWCLHSTGEDLNKVLPEKWREWFDEEIKWYKELDAAEKSKEEGEN